MRGARWLLAALVAVSLAACGGDDEPSNDEIRKPPLTVPQDDSAGDETDTATDTTEPPDTTPDTGGATTSPGEPPLDQPNPGNGGVPAPDTNDPPADPPRDSPENDTPPEPGSPEERFEQFCTENPGAC